MTIVTIPTVMETLFIIKLNSSLDKDWINQIGTSYIGNGLNDTQEMDFCTKVSLTSSEQVMALCLTSGELVSNENSSGKVQPVLMKLKPSGNLISINQYGNSYEGGSFIKDSTSVSYMLSNNIFGGNSLSINADGSIFIGSSVNSVFSQSFTAENGDNIGTKSVSQNDFDPWVMKIQESGGELSFWKTAKI